MCARIPAVYIPELHGCHKKCYKAFTNTSYLKLCDAASPQTYTTSITPSTTPFVHLQEVHWLQPHLCVQGRSQRGDTIECPPRLGLKKNFSPWITNRWLLCNWCHTPDVANTSSITGGSRSLSPPSVFRPPLAPGVHPHLRRYLFNDEMRLARDMTTSGFARRSAARWRLLCVLMVSFRTAR